jgi:plasmid stabilization system protein ParE
MKLVWHELAEAEFNEAVDYYLIHAGADIGRKFVTALDSTLVLLKEHPAIGALTRAHARRMPIHGFPFHLVYRLESERMTVIAIANQRRPPGYWAGRR